MGRQEDLDFIDDLYIFPSAICLAGFLIIDLGNFQNLNLNKVTPSIDKFYIAVSGFSLHKFRMLWVHLSQWNVLHQSKNRLMSKNIIRSIRYLPMVITFQFSCNFHYLMIFIIDSMGHLSILKKNLTMMYLKYLKNLMTCTSDQTFFCTILFLFPVWETSLLVLSQD